MMVLQGLEKSFDGKAAIVDLSLDIFDNEYLTLLGPSGSGKSILLRLIAGLERPDAGSITLHGENITGRPTHLRGLGFVQQNYALFPHLSVRDNVDFGLRYRLVDPIKDEGELARRSEAMLGLVGLEGLGDRMVGEISGGQKQRVSLARTLITEPKICLLDEPLGALDANLRERMTVELRRIRATLGVTFLHVTGNEAEALAMGDRMIVLDQGRILQVDDPGRVFSAPASVSVAKFANNYNILTGKTEDGTLIAAGTELPLPDTARTARHCAIGFDRVAIGDPSEPLGAGRAGMTGQFITREFMGSRVLYFFKRPDGGVLEVERHLSREAPLSYQRDETCQLSWAMEDVLLFDAEGARLGTPS